MDSVVDTPALSPGESPRLALFSWEAHVRLWLVVAIGLTADLWTKNWAFTTLDTSRTVIANILSFHQSQNSGALMGIGKGQTGLFIAASIAALIFVLYVFARSYRQQYSFHIALGMVLAGALGNLYDRITRQGLVRDFIKIEIKAGDLEIWPWVFNVADMLLVCGVGLLMINIWSGRKDTPAGESEHDSTSG